MRFYAPFFAACIFALVDAAPVDAGAVDKPVAPAKPLAPVDKPAVIVHAPASPPKAPVDKPAPPAAKAPAPANDALTPPHTVEADDSAAAPLSPADIVDHVMQRPIAPPLRWSTSFPDEIHAGTELELSWTGGDVEYGFEVYYIPRWFRQRTYDLITIEPNTTEQTISWTVPQISEYPKGTTFIFGVKDGSEGPGGNWYDLTGPLPFVEEVKEDVVEESA